LNNDPELVQRLIEGISDAINEAYNGQSDTECPHCGKQKMLPVVPLNPILICICTECNGYVLPFCGCLLPLSKGAIESGNEEDRKFEVVQAIMKLLHEAVRALVRKKVGEDEEAGESGEIPDEM
jgi:hypothetical protein